MAVDKNKLIAEATKFVQKGQWDKAIKVYERIVAEDPRDVRVLLKIGELQQKKNDPGAAAVTMHAVAEAYTEQGFFLKAVAVYKQIIRLTPEDMHVNERLATLYQQLGIMSDAMAQLQLVAAAAERGGDEKRLGEVLRRMADLDPENPAPAAKLGELLAKQGDARGALELLHRSAEGLKKASRMDEYLRVAERIVALEPANMLLGRELAQLYLARGDTRRALAKLQLCFKANQDDIVTLKLLAQAFQELGQVSKTVSVHKELARIHTEQGRLGEARLTWERVLELAPDDPDAADALEAGGPHGAKTSAARTSADFAGAPAPQPDAVGAPPRRTTSASADVASARAAWAASDAGASDDTSSAASAAAPPPAPVGPEAIPKLLNETDVYLKYGLNAKAAEHLEKVFAIDPDHLDAHERMRELRATQGDTAAAVEHGVRLVRAALAKGDAPRARGGLERLQVIAPQDPSVAELAVSLQGDPAAPPPAAAPSAAAETAADAAIETDALETDALETDALDAVEGTDILVEVDADDEPPAEELIVADELPPTVETGVAMAGAAEGPDLSDELAEIDFYIHQGLLDEAREALSSLLALYPEDPGLAQRHEQLQRAEIDASLSAGESPRALEDEEAALNALQYSVDDALMQFRRGVEQQVRPEDADTHFDLGLAYKQMGLLDEALRELGAAMSASSGRKVIDCLTMIGLCRLEQGDAASAVASFRAALDSPHVTADAARALHYELAMAYRALGDGQAALWYLNKVLRDDPGFRDARGQAAALGPGEGRPPADSPELAGAPGVAATS